MSDLKSRQLNLTLTEKTWQSLLAIDKKHGHAPASFGRKALEGAVDFYEKHGWISFPVAIIPETFQAEYVAEQQAAYGKSIKGSPAADQLSRDLTDALRKAGKRGPRGSPKSAPSR